MWGGDLSNIELRILAYDLEVQLGESALADAFRNNEDVHWANARNFGFIELATNLITAAGLPVDDDILKAVARNAFAKTATYAVLYGGGASAIEVGASRGLPFKLPRGTGKLVIDTMNEKMPALPELKKLTWKQARKDNGVVHTIGGRPLLVKQILSRNRELKAAGERKAFNYRLQGSAAEIMKVLHLETHDYVRSMNASIAAAVHDELLGYTWHTDRDQALDMTNTLSYHFSSAGQLGEVPIKAEFTLGNSWGDIH